MDSMGMVITFPVQVLDLAQTIPHKKQLSPMDIGYKCGRVVIETAGCEITAFPSRIKAVIDQDLS
jgi:hypothetical protein